MEQFLEQSAQAEDNFYRMEEQRLQAEDHRREAEHTRELHMLQMLGQMFSSISSARPSSATTHTRSAPLFSGASPTCARGQSGQLRQPSPHKGRFTPQSQRLSPDPQGLGIVFSVLCEEKSEMGHVSCDAKPQRWSRRSVTLSVRLLNIGVSV